MAYLLLIDDDEHLRGLLQRMLRAAGHAVATAGNGVEGLRWHRAEPADVVITDIFMPDQDGLGTILQLRREFPGLGIIAISGSKSRHPNWLTVAEHLGVRRTLAKPFTLPELTEAIAEVLAAESHLSGRA